MERNQAKFLREPMNSSVHFFLLLSTQRRCLPPAEEESIILRSSDSHRLHLNSQNSSLPSSLPPPPLPLQLHRQLLTQTSFTSRTTHWDCHSPSNLLFQVTNPNTNSLLSTNSNATSSTASEQISTTTNKKSKTRNHRRRRRSKRVRRPPVQ